MITWYIKRDYRSPKQFVCFQIMKFLLRNLSVSKLLKISQSGFDMFNLMLETDTVKQLNNFAKGI